MRTLSMRAFRMRGFSGFTLAELIVVITVLAILSAIGFLALSWYSQDAKDARSKTNVRSVYTAIIAESAVTGNSARYYVVHDPSYALSGGIVAIDGNPAALTGGDWNQAGTNYSAGNPDWMKLKLNPDKFRISSELRLPFVVQFANAATDSQKPIVGAADLSRFPSSGKTRTESLIQVVSLSGSGNPVVSVIGNFPVGLSGSVSGLVKDPGSSSSTGALVDGWKASASTSCPLGQSWSGTTSSCVQTAYVFSKTISSNVSNYNLKSDAIAAGWNQTLPLLASVTVNAGVTVGASSTSAHAFDTGTWYPAGSQLVLVNNGYVVGAGWRWGDGNQGWSGNLSCYLCVGPTSGGGALNAAIPVSVANNGTIGGGGGGWAGGGGLYNGYGYAGGGGGGWAGSVAGAGGWHGYNYYNSGDWMGSTNGSAGSLTSGGAAWSNSNGGGLAGAGGGLWMPGSACVGYIGSLHGWCGATWWAAGPAVNGKSNVTFTSSGTVLWALNKFPWAEFPKWKSDDISLYSAPNAAKTPTQITDVEAWLPFWKPFLERQWPSLPWRYPLLPSCPLP